jgi:hypothetical protein
MERDTQQNNQLLALLYSLNTPGLDNAYLFDSGIERICIDTGASACLSAKKENFVHLTQVKGLQISGIGSGLNVEGIGILKWSMSGDMGNEIDLFIKDALYVPSAPMGLFCPQQIAQQTKTPNDGFHAIAEHAFFNFGGIAKQLTMRHAQDCQYFTH